MKNNIVITITVLLAITVSLIAYNNSVATQQELTEWETIMSIEDIINIAELEAEIELREFCTFLLEENGGHIPNAEREAVANNLFCQFN